MTPRTSPARIGALLTTSTSHWTAAAAALLLAACHPAEPAQPMRASGPAGPDAGAPVLAAVQNARAAIAAGDSVAAFNDVNVGVGYAASLPGAGSAIFPPEAPPPGYHSHGGDGGYNGRGQGGRSGRHRGGGAAAAAGAPSAATPAQSTTPAPAQAAAAPDHRARHDAHGEPAPFSAFDAQVKLQSAQAELQARDTTGADADLEAIETAAQPPVPASLPLIRAGQSLTLAQDAVSGGQLPELRSQLTIAQAALHAYRGAPHAAEAKALAVEIGRALTAAGGLEALAPAQLTLWSGRVSAWT